MCSSMVIKKVVIQKMTKIEWRLIRQVVLCFGGKLIVIIERRGWVKFHPPVSPSAFHGAPKLSFLKLIATSTLNL